MSALPDAIPTVFHQEHPSVALDALLSDPKPGPLPKWLEPVKQRRLRWTTGVPLSKAARHRFIIALTRENMEQRSDLVRAVRPHLNDLDCYKLCRTLSGLAKDPEDPWPLYMLAHIGSPFQIETLGRDLEDVALGSESLHPMLDMVEVLRRNGSPAAVRWLEHWARESHHSELGASCREALDQLAEARSTTVDDVVEGALPRLGFDGNGVQVVDYGKRSVTVRIKPDGGLIYEDETGKLLKTVPRARKDDDKRAVKRGRRVIKEVRRELKDLLEQQTERLEAAMGYGRCWPADIWRSRFIDHPIMRTLARHLVYTYSDGTHTIPFTVDFAGRMTDVNDDPVEFTGTGTVHILHPVHLSKVALKRWRARVSQTSKTGKPPFKQLRRQCFVRSKQPDSWEAIAETLRPAATYDLSKRVRKLGYTKRLQKSGDATEMTRSLGPYRIRFVHEPYAPTAAEVLNTARLREIVVVHDGVKQAPEELPDEVFSEVLRDAHLLFAP